MEYEVLLYLDVFKGITASATKPAVNMLQIKTHAIKVALLPFMSHVFISKDLKPFLLFKSLQYPCL